MRILLLLLAALAGLSQAACNTARGLGQDVEAAGEAVGDLADETEEELED